MFDVLDIFLPEVPSGAEVAVRQRAGAFGLAEDELVLVRGVAVAEIVASPRVGLSALLSTGRLANQAAMQEQTWKPFLEGLEGILRLGSAWLVVCESDCDQRRLLKVQWTPARLAEALDTHRKGGLPVLALEVEPSLETEPLLPG